MLCELAKILLFMHYDHGEARLKKPAIGILLHPARVTGKHLPNVFFK